MSLIKLATNAFTRNWQNLSNASKITIGKSKAIRPERQFLVGHIKGNENIAAKMAKNNINISHVHSNILPQYPMGMATSSKSGILVNVKDTFKNLKELLPKLGNTANIGKENSKKGRYLTSQVKRHELREIDVNVNKIRKANNSKTEKINKAFGDFIKKDDKENAMKDIGKLMKRKHYLETMKISQKGMFGGHGNKSIPMADIKQSLKMPNNLGKPMLDMRLQEFPYLG